MTVGASWCALRALDVYVRVMAGNFAPPEEGAWRPLNATGEPLALRIPNCEDWWLFDDDVSYGQRPSITETMLAGVGGTAQPVYTHDRCFG